MLPYPIDGFPEMLGAWQRVFTFRADAPPSGIFEVFEIQYETPEVTTGAFSTIKALLEENRANEIKEEGQTLYVYEGGRLRHTIHRAYDLISWSVWPR
jgi:hypothetical protein